jgi:hypothetical protein
MAVKVLVNDLQLEVAGSDDPRVLLILDAAGRTLFRSELHDRARATIHIDLTNWSSGLYAISLLDAQGSSVLRFVRP